MKSTPSLMVSILLLLNFSMAQTQNSAELKNITISRLENTLEVKIELDKLPGHKSFSLTQPNRLVIDLLQVNKFSCDPFIEVFDLGIKDIRIGKYQPDVTRVVFDFSGDPSAYAIKENKNGLTVTFWYETRKEEKAIKKPSSRVPEQTLPEPPVKTLSEYPGQITKEKMTISIGIIGGLYYMHSQHFQDVYGKRLLFMGGETDIKFPLRENECLGVSLGFKHISEKGASDYPKSKLKITPVSLSALYLRRFGVFSPYFGLGIDYYNFSENSPESYDVSLISNKTWGANIQLGTYVELTPSFALKLYFIYHNAEVKENNLEINIGGNEYGLAWIYNFKF